MKKKSSRKSKIKIKVTKKDVQGLLRALEKYGLFEQVVLLVELN